MFHEDVSTNQTAEVDCKKLMFYKNTATDVGRAFLWQIFV
jgi:hypothetical protein